MVQGYASPVIRLWIVASHVRIWEINASLVKMITGHLMQKEIVIKTLAISVFTTNS